KEAEDTLEQLFERLGVAAAEPELVQLHDVPERPLRDRSVPEVVARVAHREQSVRQSGEFSKAEVVEEYPLALCRAGEQQRSLAGEVAVAEPAAALTTGAVGEAVDGVLTEGIPSGGHDAVEYLVSGLD